MIDEEAEIQRRLRLYDHLEKLLNKWLDWEHHKEFYLNELLPQLQAQPPEGATDLEKEERDLINAIQAIATREEWRQLPQLAREFIENRDNKILRQRIEEEIANYLKNLEVQAADELYLKYPGAFNEYLTARRDAISNACNRLEDKIQKGGYQAAKELWEQLQPYLSERERQRFLTELQPLKLEYERKQIKSELENLCNAGRFEEANQVFQNQSLVSSQEYEEIKLPYIEQFIVEEFGYKDDREKALAVAKSNKNVLVKARAGSGKTTAIACKTLWLIEKEGVHPDHILILAFNRKAADEIGERIRKNCKAFQNARTFHSLAYQLVLPSQKPLFDDGHGDLSQKKLSLFVQRLVRRIWNPEFRLKMYLFFRKELEKIERSKVFLSDEEYYLYRRNLPEITLGGERVKSRGEKYIADFLFEHGIDYQYERTWQWGKRPYRPDFTLEIDGRVYVIEHWAIDETLKSGVLSSQNGLSIDREAYLQEMKRKREFWKQVHPEVILIETSIKDMREGREVFEERLRERLEQVGITCRKLPQAELLKKLKEIHLSRMTELFVQFIQRAKKKRLTPQDVAKEIPRISDPRTRIFWELAHRVYSEYEKALQKEGRYDFDDLLMKAIQTIHDTRGECRIRIAHGREVALNELQWILIDEYQDFSQLFYELIDAIRKHNPQVRLFCVGDDWQAINAFAGSDLYYFKNFSKLFGQKDSGTATLLTNYRCRARIVENSNHFMKQWDNSGEFSRPWHELPGGKIVIKYVDDVWLDLEDPAHAQNSQDHRFLPEQVKSYSTRLLLGKYSKKCYEIIVNNFVGQSKSTTQKGRKVAILSRTNSLYGLKLPEFEEHLRSCFRGDQLKALGRGFLDVSTVHSYKGLEADIVILLEACKRSFPLIHPDSQLFEPLGSTPQKVLDEERRLFYVAITRARDGLWILTERDRESDFLRYLTLTQ